jgi:hypothetical protein
MNAYHASKARVFLFIALLSLGLQDQIRTASAETPVIYTMGGQNAADLRVQRKMAVLNKIVEVTKAEYGPLEIKTTSQYMEREYELGAIARGDEIQIAIQSPNIEWEKRALTIFIPTDKGMTGCKIFLIRKDSQKIFDKVKTLADLKKIPLGVNAGWTTTIAMQAEGFNLVKGTSYKDLFPMLMNGRFDGIVRGVNEFQGEYESHKEEFPDLAIEQHVSLCFPNPQYIFITPKRPDLLRRFETGMMKIVDNGDLDALLAPEIATANYANRVKFYIDRNAALTTPEDIKAMKIKKYWFHP